MMRTFTKLFLSLAMLFGVAGGVNAVTMNATYGTPAAEGSWDSDKQVYSWTAGYNNLMTIFSFGNGELANYTSIHLTTSDNTDTYRICFMNGGTAVATIGFWSAGQKDINFADRDETKNLDLASITHISFGGNSGSGSITLSNAYLEGPDQLSYEVLSLGSRITFEEALVSTEPFVVVQNGKVLCGPLAGGDAMTFKDVSEIEDYSWTIKFEEDAANEGSYFMELYNAKGVSKGFINGSIWSHAFLSNNVDKNGTKGERQDGALWTITSLNNGKYSIRNLGVAEGNYNNEPNADGGDRVSRGEGYLAITTNGYWANHVTHYNTSGEWEFYTLSVTQLPTNDPIIFAWEDLTFDNSAIVDNDKRIVSDPRDWAFYWAPSAHWDLPEGSRDISAYRYLVVYSTQNASDHNGAIYVTDEAGNTMRGGDYKTYTYKEGNNDVNKDYNPAPTGSMVLDTWSNQHIAVVDLQFIANPDKFGDGSACGYVDTKKVTSIGISASAEGACINFAYLTNTMPNTNGDYVRNIDAFDQFGTICLPYNAVCSGAKIYEIASKSSDYIYLNRVYGLMEAGKPYFYKTVEAKIGYWNDGIAFRDEEKLYFFKAGFETVEAPVENNGLIGSFVDGSVPSGENFWVLSDNKLYSTDDVVTYAIQLPANRAYIDEDKIENKPADGGRVYMSIGGDATAISQIENSLNVQGNAIYNLNGQRISQPKKGINIINGKKMILR